MNSDLASTIIALKGGLANINPQNAAGAVEGWRQRLEGQDFPHAAEIRDALGELTRKLTSGDYSGILDLLARLGNLTTAASEYAPAEVREDVHQLGQLLHRAANRQI